MWTCQPSFSQWEPIYDNLENLYSWKICIIMKHVLILKETWFWIVALTPGGSDSKASACNAADRGLIPGSGRSPGEANGNPLQYYCLENPMDGGAWQLTVLGVAKSQTWLSDFTFHLSSLTHTDTNPHTQLTLLKWYVCILLKSAGFITGL